jgi:exopolysaccharide production protein ExoQ
MPPALALTLTLLFIAYLFRGEFRQEYRPSFALSIPCIYLLILGSRSVSQWVSLGTPISAGDIEEGSPLDRTVFLALIIAGLVVLWKRRISWSWFFRNNIALTLFVLYCGISIVWSDFPFVAFKRWTKGFGDPIMVLIILTELEPMKAAQFVFKTCSYVLIPLSVLFIKYYPHLGRGFSEWTGAASNTGVTTNKNLLGFVLMVTGLFLVWRLSARWGGERKPGKWIDDIGIPVFLLGMVGWLLQITDSKTSLVCLILGILVFMGLGLGNVRAHVGSYLIAGILTFLMMQVTFDITGVLIREAGRDSTLTGRTEMWDVLLQMDPRPIFGHGFESFWLGDRLRRLHEMYAFKPNQAHNGYIEMYLNLGWVGLLFLAAVVLSCFVKVREMLTSGSGMTERILFGRFGMAFLAAFVVYNYTEAAFKSLHFLFVIFLLFMIKYPELQQRIAQSSPFGFTRDVEGAPSVTGVGDLSLSPSAAPGLQDVPSRLHKKL